MKSIDVIRSEFEATVQKSNDFTARMIATSPFATAVYKAMIDARARYGLEPKRIYLSREITSWIKEIEKSDIESVWGMPATTLTEDYHNCFQIILEDGAIITHGFMIPESNNPDA